MSDPKPFASLSSGLLARKGAARPAMRPQGFGQVGNGLEDLGWNDMGGDQPKVAPVDAEIEHGAFGEDIVEHPRAYHPTGLSPIDSPVHGQQAEIADRFAADADAAGEEYDEDFDETAELYDPSAPFVTSEDDEEGEDEDDDVGAAYAPPLAFEPAPTPAPFTPKKQMALDAPLPISFDAAPEPKPELVALVPETVAFVPQPIPAPVAEPVAIATPEPVAAMPAPSAAPRRLTQARALPGRKAKAAFTLRLDPERHLKLRLACAVDGRSAQMLVTAALDQLLADMPDLQDMVDKANRKG